MALSLLNLVNTTLLGEDMSVDPAIQPLTAINSIIDPSSGDTSNRTTLSGFIDGGQLVSADSWVYLTAPPTSDLYPSGPVSTFSNSPFIPDFSYLDNPYIFTPFSIPSTDQNNLETYLGFGQLNKFFTDPTSYPGTNRIYGGIQNMRPQRFSGNVLGASTSQFFGLQADGSITKYGSTINRTNDVNSPKYSFQAKWFRSSSGLEGANRDGASSYSNVTGRRSSQPNGSNEVNRNDIANSPLGSTDLTTFDLPNNVIPNLTPDAYFVPSTLRKNQTPSPSGPVTTFVPVFNSTNEYLDTITRNVDDATFSNDFNTSTPLILSNWGNSGLVSTYIDPTRYPSSNTNYLSLNNLTFGASNVPMFLLQTKRFGRNAVDSTGYNLFDIDFRYLDHIQNVGSIGTDASPLFQLGDGFTAGGVTGLDSTTDTTSYPSTVTSDQTTTPGSVSPFTPLFSDSNTYLDNVSRADSTTFQSDPSSSPLAANNLASSTLDDSFVDPTSYPGTNRSVTVGATIPQRFSNNTLDASTSQLFGVQSNGSITKYSISRTNNANSPQYSQIALFSNTISSLDGPNRDNASSYSNVTGRRSSQPNGNNEVNRNDITNSPLGSTNLSNSSLDDLNNPNNPDPTTFTTTGATVTSNQTSTPPAPSTFNQTFSEGNTYLDNVDSDIITNSPLANTVLSVSELDDLNNPFNPDPTSYTSTTLVNQTSAPVAPSTFTQTFSETNTYLDNVSNDVVVNSPLASNNLTDTELDDLNNPLHPDPTSFTTIGATVTPNQTTTPGPASVFNQSFSETNTYLDNVDSLNSPLVNNNLTDSELDDLNNPSHPDPTTFITTEQTVTSNQTSTNNAPNQFSQPFSEANTYLGNINNNSTSDSPLASNNLTDTELDDSVVDDTEYPPTVPNPTSFTQLFNDNNTYESNTPFLTDTSLLSNLDNTELEGPDNPNPDNTAFPPTNTSNTTLIPGENSLFTQEFSENNTYSDNVNNQTPNNSPLKTRSLDISELDDIPLSEIAKIFNENAEISPLTRGRTIYPLGNFAGNLQNKPAELFIPSFSPQNTYLESGILN